MSARRGFARLRSEWWLVTLVLTLLIGLVVASGATRKLDNIAYDFLLRHSGREAQPQIFLVTIDNRALEEGGPWPWPRGDQARLLEQLGKAKPLAIAYDVLLLEPGDKAGDDRLASAIGGAGPVYLPVQFNIPGRNGSAADVVQPVEALRNAAAGLGHVNLSFDPDGLVRRIHLSFADRGQQWPQLMRFMRNRARGAGEGASPRPDAKVEALAGSLVARDEVLIAYAGPQGHFPAISASSVLRGEVPAEMLRGKLVLVGATASGVGDAYSTPVGSDGSLMPGIEIQAHLLDAMLSNRLITPVTGAWPYGFALFPLFALLLALRFMTPRRIVTLIAGLLVLILAVSIAALRWQNLWLPPGSAVAGIVCVYPLWAWRRLAAVSSYMAVQLEALSAETDLFGRGHDDLPRSDFVQRQMGLLELAISRERDLRRFLKDRLMQMPDSVLVCDPAGKVLIANQGAAELAHDLTGAAEVDGLDQLLSRLHPVPGAARDKALSLAGAAKGLAEPWSGQAESANGRFFDLRIEPQHSDDDVIVGHVVRIVDTTEISAMQRQREDIMQLLTHDMRSPQSSIIALLDNTGTTGISVDLATRIRTYAGRTLKLADDFVQLSRAQLLQYRLEEINLADIVHDAADALWPQSSARGIIVDVSVPGEELVMSGERSLLTRMLINLIENAIKFSPDGSTVEVTLERTKAGSGNSAICTVSDSGTGMEPEQLSVLYQRFQRAPSGPAKGAGGVGLGLAFVHTVVVRHNGTIACTSTPGAGTRFMVTLPLQ